MERNTVERAVETEINTMKRERERERERGVGKLEWFISLDPHHVKVSPWKLPKRKEK